MLIQVLSLELYPELEYRNTGTVILCLHRLGFGYTLKDLKLPLAGLIDLVMGTSKVV